MKKSLLLKFGATLLGALIIPALAFSQGPEPDTPDGPGDFHAMGHGQWGPGHEEMGMHGQMGMHRWVGRGHEMGLEWVVNNPKLRQELGITDEQAAKIRQESLDFKKAEIRLRADMELKSLDLHSLLSAEKPDRAAIYRSLQEVSAAQMASEKARIDHHLATRELLTPAQTQKLREMRETFEHRGPEAGGEHGMMMHREHMMQHGPSGAPPAPPQQQ